MNITNSLFHRILFTNKLIHGHFFQVQVTEGDEIRSAGFVTDLAFQNISAIITYFLKTCWIEASIAEAKNIPMISTVSSHIFLAEDLIY